ncbi:TlpA family protein disulfide reductase [Flavobacterium sp. LS1R47]|jgi:peroxiredoxin|uniref:TlpA family protein disulfide reductase n=1 Tax=Flavobacterium frigoritolerans TaxID=2987686 RepID=A0A9X3C975_9FLAO|nr:TlpA disulfide reductase family protein [Flavobacterium frigoritolerans]MCV9933896.1 TlpA family protein disulfide reductase [Flavobacterium frigoritolerans]
MNSIKNILIAITLLLSITSVNAQIKKGDAFPNIQLQNDKNKTIKLNSYTGKTVLVDFWASWCPYCRIANKDLVKLYDKYKGQNFEIVGISVDVDKAKWLQAIVKDKLKNPQLIDPKGFDAKSVAIFGVRGIPSTYLFSKSGKLIAINPTEAQIIAQIKKQ